MQIHRELKVALYQSQRYERGPALTVADELASFTHRYHIDECSLPGVLKSHQCKFHLLFPKEGPEPVQKPVYERQHLG